MTSLWKVNTSMNSFKTIEKNIKAVHVLKKIETDGMITGCEAPLISGMAYHADRLKALLMALIFLQCQ